MHYELKYNDIYVRRLIRRPFTVVRILALEAYTTMITI